MLDARLCQNFPLFHECFDHKPLWNPAVPGRTLRPGLNYFLNHDHSLSFRGERGSMFHIHITVGMLTTSQDHVHILLHVLSSCVSFSPGLELHHILLLSSVKPPYGIFSAHSTHLVTIAAKSLYGVIQYIAITTLKGKHNGKTSKEDFKMSPKSNVSRICSLSLWYYSLEYFKEHGITTL